MQESSLTKATTIIPSSSPMPVDCVARAYNLRPTIIVARAGNSVTQMTTGTPFGSLTGPVHGGCLKVAISCCVLSQTPRSGCLSDCDALREAERNVLPLLRNLGGPPFLFCLESTSGSRDSAICPLSSVRSWPIRLLSCLTRAPLKLTISHDHCKRMVQVSQPVADEGATSAPMKEPC